MEKILVTGGAGCIGSDLAARLLERGDAVVVLDNLSSGKREHIAPLLAHPRFRFVEGDVLDPRALDRAMEGAGFVHHLAANPDIKFTPGDPTNKDLEQNLLATYQVLEAMRRAGAGKLAFSSTSAVYGIQETLPISEFPGRMQPISLYGATKLGCEALIGSFQHLFGLQVWIFRFANIVGNKVRARGRTVISDFIHRLRENPRELQILGNGKQAKSYLLADECVDAMLLAIDRAQGPFSVFNLGCDDQITVDRIAEMVVEAMELRDVQFRHTDSEGGWPGDVPRFRLDVSAINKLGWRAKHTSEQAIRRTIAGLLEQPA